MCTPSLILLAVLDLGTLFANKESWTGKAEFFAVEHAKEGFAFAGEDRAIVNCLKHETCTWYGLKVWEAKVYFDKGAEEEKVSRVELSLYNRGDAGSVTMDVVELKKTIAEVAAKLDPADKSNPEKTTQANGTTRYRRAFAKADPAAELVWGLSAADSQKNRDVDYLRLTLTPKGAVKAKVEKKPEISLDQFTHGNMISVSEMREAMDSKVIYRMRQKDPRLKKFSAGVRQQVNAGISVFWGVTLGIFPEKGVNPQSRGGHMRLIIGYNDKKKEILFTDTWGEGHELKRMPEDWAFAITHDAFFLKPR